MSFIVRLLALPSCLARQGHSSMNFGTLSLCFACSPSPVVVLLIFSDDFSKILQCFGFRSTQSSQRSWTCALLKPLASWQNLMCWVGSFCGSSPGNQKLTDSWTSWYILWQLFWFVSWPSLKLKLFLQILVPLKIYFPLKNATWVEHQPRCHQTYSSTSPPVILKHQLTY